MGELRNLIPQVTLFYNLVDGEQEMVNFKTSTISQLMRTIMSI